MNDTLSILLVDDEPKNLVALKAVLEGLDARVVTASSGSEALRSLLDEDFAVIVMDVRMPDMDGFETAALIRSRQRSAGTPILFVTGNDRTEDAIFRGYEVGAVDFIVKPVHAEILRSKVSVFLELHRKTVEVQRQAELLRQVELREHQRRLEELATAERRRAEAEVQRIAERMDLVLRTLPIVVYTGSIEGDPRPTSMSPNVERVTGFPAERFLAEPEFWASRIHPDDRHTTLARLAAIAETGRIASEYRWRCADGAYRWFLDQAVLVAGAGRPSEIAGTWLDIHDRKLGEVALEDAHTALKREMAERTLEEERLKVTLRCIGDGVVATDTEGRVRLVSHAAEALTGWTQAEAVGVPLADLFRVRDERTGKPAPTPLGSAAEEKTGLLAPREGDPRLVQYRGAPILSGSGQRLGTVLVFRDVTEKRRHEEEMLKASKLESIGVLAGGIAHDFNNLLTGITASVSLAQMYAERGKPVTERLRTALVGCDRARRLTQQLLTFARGGDPVKQNVAVDALVQEAATFALQGSRSRLVMDMQGDLWGVEADPGQLTQVIHNLVINADQAMPEGGTIRVGVRNVRLAAGEGRPLAPGNYVTIDVEDTGNGIPPELLNKIFDPFFTTKPKGSGLGLATVYSILQRHGGHVEVTSRPGRTAFRLYLPSLAEPMPEPETVEVPKLAGGAGRVLVMDDEMQIRDVALEALGALGYDVAVAKDGQEAIAMHGDALQGGRRFDVVIMDLTVPGAMGGREAIGRIRELDPHVRALVSSGYSTDPVVGNPQSFGFDGVIPKPWNIADLDQALRRLGTARPG